MPNFTSNELQVMKVLWNHGELKPAQIQEKYHRPIKNAALRFQLRVLLEKGHITRKKVGKAYYYKALTPQKNSLKEMVRRMTKVYFQGSSAGLIAELIKTEKLSCRELEHLKKLAHERSSISGPVKKGEKQNVKDKRGNS